MRATGDRHGARLVTPQCQWKINRVQNQARRSCGADVELVIARDNVARLEVQRHRIDFSTLIVGIANLRRRFHRCKMLRP